MGLFEQFED
jgi:hypothetical protein